MSNTNTITSDVNIASNNANPVHPGVEHFLNLNTILQSLVDFIRPETYIASDELQTYNELKEKYLRESASKHNKKFKGQTTDASLKVVDVEAIRATSGIYQFLAHRQKNNSLTSNNKQKRRTSVSREELLKKLHEKMPHRQQTSESTVEQNNKRKRSKDQSKSREKKHSRSSTKEWTVSSTTDFEISKPSNQPSTINPTKITYGRFDFNTEDSNNKNFKKKNLKTKQKQLITTLKQVEFEQNEIDRLKEENPEQGKELLHSKHWKTALAKAKGEKIRDNAQLLRKTIKKQKKIRERSAKKWQKNKSEIEKRKNERQEKRQTNLQKRKDDKKAKLKKKLIKKGRLIS